MMKLNKIERLAREAKEKGLSHEWWTHDSLREYVCDESLELDGFDYEYIASVSPDVVLKLIERLKAADAVVDCCEHAFEIGYFDEGGSTAGWMKDCVKKYRQLSESINGQ